MIDMNPFRITIIYRSGAVETFTSRLWETQKQGNELVGFTVDRTNPRKVYTRMDDVVSITSRKRFPWGLLA